MLMPASFESHPNSDKLLPMESTLARLYTNGDAELLTFFRI